MEATLIAIEHDAIPQADLHELKGADTATSGHVPVSDGAGSHTWQLPPSSGTKTVVVNSEADFPTPSAGSITLVAGINYRIANDIAMVNKIIASDKSSLSNDNYLGPTLSYAGTGTFITGTDVDFTMHDIHIDCPNATLFDFTDTVGGVKRLFLHDFFVDNCAAIGDFDQYLSVVMYQGTFNNATTGLTTTNNTTLFSMQSVAFVTTSASFTGINLGTSVFTALELQNVFMLTTNAAATAISGAASSANIAAGSIGVIKDCEFLSFTTPVSGITNTDVRWSIKDNLGIDDTSRACSGYILGNATATTIATVSTPVKVDFGTGWLTDLQDQWASDNTGRHTYNGPAHTFHISGNIYADNAAGTNVGFRWYMYKNGVQVAASVTQREYDSGSPGSTAIVALVPMEATDYLELWVENITNNSNITCVTHSITLD